MESYEKEPQFQDINVKTSPKLFFDEISWKIKISSKIRKISKRSGECNRNVDNYRTHLQISETQLDYLADLENAQKYVFLVKFDVDTAENEPRQVRSRGFSRPL